MTIDGTGVRDTFAEAFAMTATRLVVTAVSHDWVKACADALTGYAASVIGCDAEAGVERFLTAVETPDGRPGVSVILFAFSRTALEKAVVNRVGQCVLPCATTACYSGLPLGERPVAVGDALRYFGDGDQISKRLGGRRYWRIPTMDGEFLCEDRAGTVVGVAGGNVIICGVNQAVTLAAAVRAAAAARSVAGVITPFPGGVVRSGSKVGSRYSDLKASTNGAFVPGLGHRAGSELPPDCEAAYEVVFNGLTLEAVESATRLAVLAACGDGVRLVTAGNYGGKLGPHHIGLHRVLGGDR